ncbi:hypothetical protein AB832_02975 [Flavobacteriaceae bacterium (ex Bugula neritina AB1)]|nr:hypothetical protein AB832_02975 [Flavobacteriaceae bacterium (ex Bugula neritina AB1)]
MKKVIGLQIVAGTVGLILVGTTYVSIRNRKRDKVAGKLLQQLGKMLNPISKGLMGEEALDAKYVGRVLNKVNGSVIVLKKSTITPSTRYANEIHKAFKPWYLGGDSEESVYAVFRNLKDKVQVSQVAKAYLSMYRVSLSDQLKDRFDKDEIKTVLNIISRLPKYRKL